MTAPALECRCGPHLVCPRCSAPTHFDPRRQVVIDAHEAWHRHECGPPPVIPRILECSCGYIVALDPETGARTHYATGKPHAAHLPRPASLVPTNAERRASDRWREREDRAAGIEPEARVAPRQPQQPPTTSPPAPVALDGPDDDDMSFLEPDPAPAAPPRTGPRENRKGIF